MDTAMAQQYGALHSDPGYSSLHDEFLQDMHDTVWQRVSSQSTVYPFALLSCGQLTLIKLLQTSPPHCVLHSL